MSEKSESGANRPPTAEEAFVRSEKYAHVRAFLRDNKNPIHVIPPLGGPANDAAKQLEQLIGDLIPETSMDGPKVTAGVGVALMYAKHILGYKVSDVVDENLINPFTGTPVTIRIFTPPASPLN